MPLRYCQKKKMMMHHRCFQEVVVSSPLWDPAKKSHHRRVDLETSCLLLLIGKRLTKALWLFIVQKSFALRGVMRLCLR